MDQKYQQKKSGSDVTATGSIDAPVHTDNHSVNNNQDSDEGVQANSKLMSAQSSSIESWSKWYEILQENVDTYIPS